MIERYIQFAIDNFDNRNWELVLWWINKIEYIDHNWLLHYESIWYWTWEDAPTWLWIPLHTLITSKPFIEAVARGIIRNSLWKEALEENIQKAFKHSIFKNRVDKITTQQAIAIRDGDLSTFITNILWK